MVFAGPVAALPARLAALPEASRTLCLGYVDRIDALLGVSDLCLNPRRTGGGASAMQALAAALPIVSFASGDVASVAGPGMCVADADAFVSRVLALSHGAEEKAQARTDARDRYAALVEEGGDGERLSAYIEEAQALFLSQFPLPD